MRNAAVGVQRLIARLRPDLGHRSAAAVKFQRHGISIARALGVGSTNRRRPASARPARSDNRPAGVRPSGERLVSVTAVGLVAIALVLSNLGVDASSGSGPIGNTSGAGSEPRIALGGAVSGIQGAPQGGIDATVDGEAFDARLGADLTSGASILAPDDRVTIDGPFSSDGTLVKPISVDTTVADGADLIRTYRVKSGDTLTGIARQFHVSMMTVWWANHLTNKDTLKVGQTLTIPPVNGLVVTVATTDTLESLAAKYQSDPTDIIEVNGLTDPVLVVGQTLTIPGARSAQIATPKPKPTKAPVSKPTTSRPATSGGGSVRPPAQYSGGTFAWPVAGGYISQYYHYGHYGLDIAADRGTRVMAAAGGTVIFAGWKNNGGGYQVWIAHGSGLYTTYNHMMSVAVGRGQHVGRGQQVGRVGMTGNATGPHLHFEVWRGMIWDGGTRVNPLSYL